MQRCSRVEGLFWMNLVWEVSLEMSIMNSTLEEGRDCYSKEEEGHSKDRNHFAIIFDIKDPMNFDYYLWSNTHVNKVLQLSYCKRPPVVPDHIPLA